MTSSPDPLTAIPNHVLAQITGARRKALIEHLVRWDAPQAALAAVDYWRTAQPDLATLRELRAALLTQLGHAADALPLLDALDAERGPTQSRRAARVRALAALGEYAQAHALLPEGADDPQVWRQRAELHWAEGRFAEAEAALGRMAALLPEGVLPTRSLAELALARGDAAEARRLLAARVARLADEPPAVRDLQLLRQAAHALGDADAAAELDAQLARRREAEERKLRAELGLDAPPAEQPAPQVELLAHHAEAAVDEAALTVLREHFGFGSLRPGQSTVIRQVLAGEHVLGILPTGAGKSLTYQLPALMMDGATLVISPLIALMKDQIDNLPPALAERATTINSSLEGGEVAARLRGIAEGRYRLIFVAPERLRQQTFVEALRRVGLARVVVDEAHCVSLWGMSFRPDYLFIRRALVALGGPPVLALTATATPETEDEIKGQLGDLATVRTSVFRPNLRFEVVQVANKSEKLAATLDLCRAIAGPVVVYVRSREGCEEVAHYLRQKGESAAHYHAQIADRSAVQDQFMSGEVRILVATVAFGMGVDKADVRAIIHYNLPQSIEAYYQEAGRAGRDGQPARCVLLYAPTDKGQLTGWLREDALTKEYLREVYRWLRRAVGGLWGVVSLDELRRDLREQDETRMRVALGMLERVGLLVRHFDLPRSVTITLRDQLLDDAQLRDFADVAGLEYLAQTGVDLIGCAEAMGLAPDALERMVIGWHSQGLLRYAASARDVLLEMRRAGPDVGADLDELLQEYAARQNERIEAIASYARSARCRHRLLAEHFGEQLDACGSSCDMCAPDGAARPASAAPRRAPALTLAPASMAQALLSAVAELPGQLGEKELVCVAQGVPGYPPCAAYGQLAGADFAAVRGAVAALLASGRLAYRSRALVVADGPPRPAGPDFAQNTIIRCLSHMPFAVGKSGLAKVLKGAAGSPIGPERCAEYAALGHMTGAAIEAEIERMIGAGLLLRSEGPRPLLRLADHAELVD